MKKIKNIILTFVLMFSIMGVVKAEEYSIDVDAQTGSAGATMKMTLNGITDLEKIYKNEIKYFVKFVNESDSKPTVQTLQDITDANKELDEIDSYFSVLVSYNEEDDIYKILPLQVDNDWYMLDDYSKAYIIKCVKNTDTLSYACEVPDTPIEIEKPALPELTQRYHMFLFEETATTTMPTLSVYPYFPNSGDNGDHEINVKIGLINDENLLKKLARNDAGSLEELIAHAKTSDGEIFTHKDTEFSRIPIGEFDVINGAYYYMYTYYTNSDGLYRNLDDISIVMGHADMLVNDVDWSRYNTLSLWDQYIEKYSETSIIKNYKDLNANVTIASSDTTLNSIIDDGSVKLIGNFKYEDGIVTYVLLDDKEVSYDTIFNENQIVENAILALANLKGYDATKFNVWLTENEGKLNLEKDGMEYTLEDYTVKQDNGAVVTVKKVSSFKFILDRDFNFDVKKPQEKVENPSTGMSIAYGILVLVILISGVGYFLIRKQSKFPKHN